MSSAIQATIAKLELISLLGASGCGKTIFLRIIANFEQASTARSADACNRADGIDAHLGSKAANGAVRRATDG
ncbi:ATP-binding cassette domain-containing protein [Paraburkholderia sp. DGU8]|uniref:ATP-binding cassette domain-containing protein n=1 Tax=Paraburkholderia sp. DGU8 TaxID=3161997 RepID=UPI0034663188